MGAHSAHQRQHLHVVKIAAIQVWYVPLSRAWKDSPNVRSPITSKVVKLSQAAVSFLFFLREKGWWLVRAYFGFGDGEEGNITYCFVSQCTGESVIEF